jgi:hypothetical protein
MSVLFADWLSSHPGIENESEIILQYIREETNNERKDMTQWDFVEFKNVFMQKVRDARAKHRGKEAVGVTIMDGQGASEFGDQFAKLLAQLDMPVIHLLRRNKLRMLISRQAMRYQRDHLGDVEEERGQNRGHALDQQHLALLRAYKPPLKVDILVDKLTGRYCFFSCFGSLE